MLERLFVAGKLDNVKTPTYSRLQDYGREDDYFDPVYSLESHSDKCNGNRMCAIILPDRYNELQNRTDDMQDEFDELNDIFNT